MKKIALILLTFVMILSLAACVGGNRTNGNIGNTDSSQNVTDDTQTEKNTKAPSGTGSENEQPSEATDANDDDSAYEPDDEPEGSKILVAYFSATNNTEGVAQKLADGLGADLYEIVPEVAYTDDDLDYNSDCRANREQNDDSARPAISGVVENMDDYDVIFLGYPIWWGQAPKIMYTFVENYDLSGKTIVPFCTSGSSPIGSSATDLQPSAANATWLDGQRFSAGASADDMLAWANGLEIN